MMLSEQRCVRNVVEISDGKQNGAVPFHENDIIVFPKIMGFPQIIHQKIGFSIINHHPFRGVFPPIFGWKHPYELTAIFATTKTNDS